MALAAALLPAAIGPSAAHADPPLTVADLGIFVTPGGVLALPDGEARPISIFLQNIGPDPATGVTIDVDLPSNVTVESATAAAATYSNGVWTLTEPVAPNAVIELTLTLSRTAPTDSVVSVEIASSDASDPDSTPGNAAATTTPEDDERSVAVHVPVDRYAAVGGMTTGDCRSVLTACTLVRAATAPDVIVTGDTVHVASGDHELGSTPLQLGPEVSLLGPPNGVKPRLLGAAGTALVYLSYPSQRLADLEIVNTGTSGSPQGVVTNSGGQTAVFERLIVRSPDAALRLNGATIVRDTVAIGGSSSGAVVTAATTTLDHVTAIGGLGGAVHALDRDVTMIGSIARSSGPADLRAAYTGTIVATASNYGSIAEERHDSVTPPESGGNQTTAPVFVDLASGDVHQAAGSPTIDAGGDVPATDRRDVDGAARVVGSAADIGADERGPALRIAPAMHEFDQQMVDANSAPFTFTVTNVGVGDVAIDTAAIVGGDTLDFWLFHNECTIVLAVGDSCALSVVFGPQSAGSKSSALQIAGGSTSAVAELFGTTPPATTMTLFPSPYPSDFGQSVAITATVTGGSTPIVGAVSFYDGVVPMGAVQLVGGQATLTTSTLSPGTHQLTARFDGDAMHSPSDASNIHFVRRASTSTTITSDSPDPSAPDQPYTVSVAVAAIAPGAGAPTGSVQVFSDAGGGCQITLDSSTGSCDLNSTQEGPGTVTAEYLGDVNFEGSTGTTDHLVRAPADPLQLPDSLPDGVVNAPYSTSAAATGGSGAHTYTVADGALPQGLSLDAATGAIGGTPEHVGVSAFTITVTDALGASLSAEYSIDIAGATLTFGPSDLPPPEVGVAYNVELTIAGVIGATTVAVTEGSLPPGLELAASADPAGPIALTTTNSTSTHIAGTPNSPGTYDFALTASDSTGSTVVRSVHMTVADALVIVTAALPNGRVGDAYAAALHVDGGVAPTSLAIVRGELPPGTSLAGDGSITGTPSVAGESAFTVRATSAAGGVVERDFTITVAIATSPPTSAPTTTATTTTVTTTTSTIAGGVGGPMPVALPATGADIAGVLGLAAIFLLAGAFMFGTRRRRVASSRRHG